MTNCFSWLFKPKYSRLDDEEEMERLLNLESLFNVSNGPISIIFEYLNLFSKYKIRKTNSTFYRLFFKTLNKTTLPEFEEINTYLVRAIARDRLYAKNTLLELDLIYSRILSIPNFDKRLRKFSKFNTKIPSTPPKLDNHIEFEWKIESVFNCVVYFGMIRSFNVLFNILHLSIPRTMWYGLIFYAYKSPLIHGSYIYERLSELARLYSTLNCNKVIENVIFMNKKRMNMDFIKIFEKDNPIDYGYIILKSPSPCFLKRVLFCSCSNKIKVLLLLN